MLKAIIASLTFDIRQLEFPYKIMIGFESFGFWFCEILISFGFGASFVLVLAKKLSFVAALLKTNKN
jgi:hypothetical protein